MGPGAIPLSLFQAQHANSSADRARGLAEKASTKRIRPFPQNSLGRDKPYQSALERLWECLLEEYVARTPCWFRIASRKCQTNMFAPHWRWCHPALGLCETWIQQVVGGFLAPSATSIATRKVEDIDQGNRAELLHCQCVWQHKAAHRRSQSDSREHFDGGWRYGDQGLVPQDSPVLIKAKIIAHSRKILPYEHSRQEAEFDEVREWSWQENT